VKPSLTVVIPAYNEAENIQNTMDIVLPYCGERGWNLIVVNDGSSDGTGKALQQYDGRKNLQIYHHKVNRGYGGALKTGISHAETDYVVTMDADGQHRLEDLDSLFETALETNADLVVGSRVMHGKADASRVYREVGKWLIRSVTSLLMPLTIRDLNSGFKLYNTALAKRYLPICPDSMSFSDIIALAFINQRHLVVERPIEVVERARGKSTINTRTAIETMFEILNIVMLFNPMRIFFPAAFIFIVAGAAWGLPIVLAGRGFSAATVLAIMTGIIFILLGLLAEQLAAIRKGSINLQSHLGGEKKDRD
jgi:glycosyltransferase involved in cell wall biosynthesis